MKPFIRMQHLVPQQTLSRTLGVIASQKNHMIKNLLNQSFARFYGIRLDDYARKNLSDFDSFNDFFTRELDTHARPIDNTDNGFVCPADGCVSQLGRITHNQLLQAKGKYYTLEDLLASKHQNPSSEEAHAFYDGCFATVYLAPSNYHRVHMPLAGKLIKTRYIPGQLFSVNHLTANNVPNLFARNERLVCFFEVTCAGKTHPMCVILVGAMIVAGIETIATGKIKPSKQIHEQKHQILLTKGSELGRFYLGSTAIVLLPNSLKAVFNADLVAGRQVKMGESLGRLMLSQTC